MLTELYFFFISIFNIIWNFTLLYYTFIFMYIICSWSVYVNLELLGCELVCYLLHTVSTLSDDFLLLSNGRSLT
jgi:hypothetical protein